MEIIRHFIDILHTENPLKTFTEQYHAWVYVLLFVIIFCETGLVVTPFLPGDSLLFAVGAFAAQDNSPIAWEIVGPLLLLAAILGNNTNYWVGRWIGPKVFQYESNRFFNRKHLMKAHAFYEKYGGRAVILAQFAPILRTFAPFVAGVGAMNYFKFVTYNITGAVVWVGLFVGGGFLFGNHPAVKENMKLVIMGIIMVSLLPIAWEITKSWLENRRNPSKS